MSVASSMQPGMFRKLPNSERKRLVMTLGSHRNTLTVKGIKDDIFNMTSEGAEGERFIHVRPIFGSLVPKVAQEVLVNFALGLERYFFHGEMHLADGKYYIATEGDFYILQRRKAARLILPEEFPSGFNIIEYQGKKVFYQMKVIDFSSGGLKVFYPSLAPALISGEAIKGVIHLGIRRPLDMDGFIRHIVRQTAGDRTGQIFGVQFDLENKIMETKLLTVFMDVQREVYIKHTK